MTWDARKTLVESNRRIQASYRLDDEEIEALLVLEERFQLPELYRSAIRKIAAKSRNYREKPPSVKTLARILRIPEYQAADCRSKSGAWGFPRQTPYKEEELEFMQNMCRPEKYRQEIEDALLRGYDPPTLPPDCYDRYIECRRLHERGYSRGADGTLRRIFNTYGRSKFGATIDRIKTIDVTADHAPYRE